MLCAPAPGIISNIGSEKLMVLDFFFFSFCISVFYIETVNLLIRLARCQVQYKYMDMDLDLDCAQWDQWILYEIQICKHNLFMFIQL